VSRWIPKPRLSYANVVATLALVLAVVGGATAIALSLPKNSVHSKQIAKEAVKTSDIAKDAVTGDKVKESTLGKVPSAAFADSAGSAKDAAHAAVADSLGSITPANLVQAQNVSGPFDETLELNVKGFGRFWLKCHQNSGSNSDDTLAFNLSSTQNGKAIDSGILAAEEFPSSTEVFPIDDTPEGGSSEYGTQGRRLYVQFMMGIIGSTKTVEIDGGGFDDEGTPGCIGQLHASVSG
jgi:hypothetical protein